MDFSDLIATIDSDVRHMNNLINRLTMMATPAQPVPKTLISRITLLESIKDLCAIMMDVTSVTDDPLSVRVGVLNEFRSEMVRYTKTLNLTDEQWGELFLP